ncbi:MAG: rod shape-determining protein [Blastocatellia bacterium]
MSAGFISTVRNLVADPDIALDLGTANTRLYANGRGVIADEPSVVRISPDTGFVESVGARAARSEDYDSGRNFIAPLHGGVVSDVGAAAALLSPLLWRARRLGLFRPRVLACVPSDACAEERAALIEATRRAGASAVTLTPEPLAAAVGIGLDISLPYAQMLVDIGDGVTDIAVIRSSALVSTAAVRTACSDLISAVRKNVASLYGVELYQREALRLIRSVGVGRRKLSSSPYVAAGADCRTGKLRRIPINGQYVAEAVDPVVAVIVEAVGRAVRELPPEFGSEVVESGIHLTGGGAGLPGIAELIAAETLLDVSPAKEPMKAVIRGASQILKVGVATNVWHSE